MHDIVTNELEQHFSGNAPRSFYAHLDACPECRAEVAAMDEISLIFRDLKSDSASVPEPRLGFYNRVVSDIVDHHQTEAWGLLSPGAAFFRRIAFASLLVLASLGSFLVTRESSAGGTDAAAIMAQSDSNHSEAPESVDRAGADRDRILVTLASYRE
jgi:anti-sigma factor RsiW